MISSSTRRLTGGLFEYRDLGAVALKGFAENVPAWRVLALSGKDLVQSGSASPVQLANFFAGDVNNRGGVRLAVKDLDGDTRADLVVGSGTGAGSRVTAFAGKSIPTNGAPPELFAFDAFAGFTGGVFVG